MEDDSCVYLDIKAFDAFIAQKERIINEYNEINEEYNAIIQKLSNNWKGKGADAFLQDAVRLVYIYRIYL